MNDRDPWTAPDRERHEGEAPCCGTEAALHRELADALRVGELDPITRADLATEALDLAEAEARVRRPHVGWVRPLVAAAAVVVVGVSLFLALPGQDEPTTPADEDEGEPQDVAVGSVDAQREANHAFLQRPEIQARIARVPDGHWIGIQHGKTMVTADALGKLDVLLKKAELPEGTENVQLAHPRALHRFTFRKGMGGDRRFSTARGTPPFLGEAFWKDVGISFSVGGDRTAFKRFDGTRMYGPAFLVERRRGKGTELPMHLGEPGSMGGIQRRVSFRTRSQAPLVLPNGMGFPRFEIPGAATLEGGADHPGVFRRYMASISIPQLGIRERFVEAIGNAEILEQDDGTLRLGGATWQPYGDRVLASALDAKKPVLLLERQRWMVGFPGNPFAGLPVEGVRGALERYVLAWRELPDRATWVGGDDDAPPAEGRLTVLDPSDPDVILRQLVVRPWTRPVHVFTLLSSSWRVWEPFPDVVAQHQKNERDAIRILRDIHRAQTTAKKQRVIDVDADGVGEYASLAELTGASAGRRAERLRPPLLPNAYAPKPQHHGDLVLAGYRIRLYLVGRVDRTKVVREGRGPGVGAVTFAGGPFTHRPAPDASNVDIDAGEKAWWALAWPEDLEITGRRTFYVDQDGEVWSTEPWAGAYEGIGAAPRADAAFAAPNRYPGGVSPALRSADGNRWQKVP